MIPEESVRWMFMQFGWLTLATILVIIVTAKGLLEKQKRILYVPLLMATISFTLAASIFVQAIFPAELHVTPSTGKTYELVQETNPLLLENLRRINHDKEELQKFPWQEVNHAVAGEYNAFFRSINMVQERTYATELTYWHELGHHIWYWKLQEFERSIWKGIWVKDTYYETHNIYPYFPSNYAKQSPEEDFADSFARWMFQYRNDADTPHFRTENLDPERERILKLIIQNATHCQEEEMQLCVLITPAAGENDTKEKTTRQGATI